MGSTRRLPSPSSQIFLRAGLSHLPWEHRSSLPSCRSSNGLVIASCRGLWLSCMLFLFVALAATETSPLKIRLSFQLLMIIIYPTVIQPLFNKLSPLAEGDLRTRIEALAGKLKFPLKHLYEIDGSKRSSHSNAYFFGLPWVSLNSLNEGLLKGTHVLKKAKHIVIFDTLIQQSKAEEVEAVLGMYSIYFGLDKT